MLTCVTLGPCLSAKRGLHAVFAAEETRRRVRLPVLASNAHRSATRHHDPTLALLLFTSTAGKRHLGSRGIYFIYFCIPCSNVSPDY
jgi:hypothetical protein